MKKVETIVISIKDIKVRDEIHFLGQQKYKYLIHKSKKSYNRSAMKLQTQKMVNECQF